MPDTTKKTIEIELKGKDGASSVLKKAAEKIESTLHGLKSGLGRGSAFGESAEILNGGGPIRGLQYAAEAINKLVEGADKVREAWRDGAGAGEVAVKLGESLPIIGQFVTAGQSIRELFTGEKAAIEEMNKSSADAVRLVNLRKDAIERTNEVLSRQAEIFRGIRQDIADMDLHGQDRDAQTIRRASEDAQQRVRDKAEADKKSATGALRKKLEADEEEVDKIKRKAGGGDVQDTPEYARLRQEIETLKKDIGKREGAIDSTVGPIVQSIREKTQKELDEKSRKDNLAAADKAQAEDDRRRVEELKDQKDKADRGLALSDDGSHWMQLKTKDDTGSRDAAMAIAQAEFEAKKHEIEKKARDEAAGLSDSDSQGHARVNAGRDRDIKIAEQQRNEAQRQAEDTFVKEGQPAIKKMWEAALSSAGDFLAGPDSKGGFAALFGTGNNLTDKLTTESPDVVDAVAASAKAITDALAKLTRPAF